MTCIVGLEQNGKVYIGGDSAGTSAGHDVTMIGEDKVFKRGDLVAGITGSFRSAQVLMYNTEIPETKEDMWAPEYMHGFLIPQLRNALKENGALTCEDLKERMDGEFLLGYGGKLFWVMRDFGLVIPSHGHIAIGAGGDYASGSLFATYEMKIPPEEKIFMALEASEYYNGSVRAPFIVMDTEGNIWRRGENYGTCTTV